MVRLCNLPCTWLVLGGIAPDGFGIVSETCVDGAFKIGGGCTWAVPVVDSATSGVPLPPVVDGGTVGGAFWGKAAIVEGGT